MWALILLPFSWMVTRNTSVDRVFSAVKGGPYVSEPACLMHLCLAFLRRSFHLWAVRSLGAFSANTRSRRMSRKVLSSACGRCDRYLVFSPSWEPCLCWCFHQPFPFGFVPFKRLPSLVSMQTCSVHRNVCSHYACFGHTRER